MPQRLSNREIHFLAYVFQCGAFPNPPEGEPLGVRPVVHGVGRNLQHTHPFRIRKSFEGASPENITEMSSRLKKTLRENLGRVKFDVSDAAWLHLIDQIRKVNLSDPLPPIDPSFRDDLETIDDWGDAPSGVDLVQTPADLKFLWAGRLVRGKLNLIASNPKVGKTTLMIEIQRRHWLGIPQYGQTNLVYPAETPSLWFCGDCNEDEVLTRGEEFGIARDGFRFVVPNDVLKTINLEDPNVVRYLEHYLAKRDYGYVSFDTVWRLTSKKLHSTEDVKALLQPYAELAAKANIAFVMTTHTSKDGDPLGRRMEGVVRSVNKLYAKGESQRKLTTEINGCRKPADLLMTIHHEKIEFSDYAPQPKDSATKSTESPRQDAASRFVLAALQSGPRLAREVRQEWDQQGGDKNSIRRIKTRLESSGALRVLTDLTGNEIWELA